MLTSNIPPSYLTTTNQKNVHELIMHPTTFKPNNVAFKNPCLKAIRGFRPFEHELPILLAWPCNKHCPFRHPTPCQQVDFAASQASKPKFGSVTISSVLSHSFVLLFFLIKCLFGERVAVYSSICVSYPIDLFNSLNGHKKKIPKDNHAKQLYHSGYVT